MSYENATSTKWLCTRCVCCGRPLVDAISVEMGIGPECRNHSDDGISDDVRKIANEHVFHAAIACQQGKIEEVLAYAGYIRELGLNSLADKVARRFKNAKRNVVIRIVPENDLLRVETPFRRGSKKDFINAWRRIPGRRFVKGANYIPAGQKKALYELLKEFFGGKFAEGPKGVFRIPISLKPKLQQSELNFAA